jgi:hypothetical protein
LTIVDKLIECGTALAHPNDPLEGLRLKVKLHNTVKLMNDGLVLMIPKCHHLPEPRCLEDLHDLHQVLEPLYPVLVDVLGLADWPHVKCPQKELLLRQGVELSLGGQPQKAELQYGHIQLKGPGPLLPSIHLHVPIDIQVLVVLQPSIPHRPSIATSLSCLSTLLLILLLNLYLLPVVFLLLIDLLLLQRCNERRLSP